MNDGFMNVSVYFHGELEPFIGYSNIFSCDDIKQYLHLEKCPVKRRGKLIKHNCYLNLCGLNCMTFYKFGFHWLSACVFYVVDLLKIRVPLIMHTALVVASFTQLLFLLVWARLYLMKHFILLLWARLCLLHISFY